MKRFSKCCVAPGHQLKQSCYIVRLWKVDLLRNKKSLQILLCSLLGMKSDSTEKGNIRGKDMLRQAEILIGLGNPLPHEFKPDFFTRLHR